MELSPSPIWAFVDESGDVGSIPGSSRYLVVAVVLARDLKPLGRAVAQVRGHLRKNLKNIPELKAKRTPKKIVARFLRRVAELDVEIVALVLDKRAALSVAEPEDWYRLTCAEAVWRCIERYDWLELVIDKRYTSETMRSRLEQSIFARATSVQEKTAIKLIHVKHSDSAQEKGVQVADAIAWSLGQKYERGDDELYEIIKGRIIVEEVLRK